MTDASPHAPDGSGSEADFLFTDALTDRIFGERSAKRSPIPSHVTRFVHAKPGPELTEDAYKSIVRNSEKKAYYTYRDHVWSAVPLLCTNLRMVKKDLQTEDDEPGGSWRIDPSQASDQQLAQEITTLRAKIAIVNQEIDGHKRLEAPDQPT
jgi:hypothetical protein